MSSRSNSRVTTPAAFSKPVAEALRVERAILFQHTPAEPAKGNQRNAAQQDKERQQLSGRGEPDFHLCTSFYARLSGANPPFVTALSSEWAGVTKG